MKRTIFDREQLKSKQEFQKNNPDQMSFPTDNFNPIGGGLGFLSGLMQSAMSQMNNVSQEAPEDVIDVEVKESEDTVEEVETVTNIEEKEAFSDDSRIIVSAVPMLFNSYNDGKIWSLEILCENKLGEFFVLLCNYNLENDIEKEMIKDTIKFSDYNSYIGQKICLSMLKTMLPVYLTDLEFEYDNNLKLNEVEQFSIKAIRRYESGADGIIEDFKVNTEIFSSLRFITDYLESYSNNQQMLTVATVSGYKKPDDFKAPKIEIVNEVYELLNTAVTKFSKTTAVIEFTFTTTDCDEKYTMLTSLDLGKKITRKMTKGSTVQKIEQSYMLDEDQYVTILNFASNFVNQDKTYLIIKAKNKKNQVKLFFFSNIYIEKILKLIG